MSKSSSKHPVREICGIIAPLQEDMVGGDVDDYLAECILPRTHFCPHVIRTPEGKLIEWADDMDCGCCKPDEDDRCTVFSEITEEELQEYVVEETARLNSYEKERD